MERLRDKDRVINTDGERIKGSEEKGGGDKMDGRAKTDKGMKGS